MKIANFLLGKAISGRPGAFFQFMRYPLMPTDHKAFLKMSSGFVFFALLALITIDVDSLFGIGALPSRK
jgi:hypothetical protein